MTGKANGLQSACLADVPATYRLHVLGEWTSVEGSPRSAHSRLYGRAQQYLTVVDRLVV